MLDFQQKRKIRALSYNKVTLIILFLLVLIFAHSTFVVYQKKEISEDMKNISLQNVEDLRSRNNELQSQIERLETNVGIEEEIRLKFNVVKEGESVVVVVEDTENKMSATSTKISIFDKIRQFFLSQ
jgi:cell division protein FtsB